MASYYSSPFLCLCHTYNQSQIDLHKAHTAIFSLSYRLQEVQHCGYIPDEQNVLFLYVILIEYIPNYFLHSDCVCLLYECSLLHPQMPSLLTSGAERALAVDKWLKAQREDQVTIASVYKQQSYCRKLPHSLEKSQQWWDFLIVKTV